MAKKVVTIDNMVVDQCDRRKAFTPSPHAGVGTKPPKAEVQKYISTNAVHLEGKNFMNSVGSCTSWPETSYTSRDSIDVQE